MINRSLPGIPRLAPATTPNSLPPGHPSIDEAGPFGAPQHGPTETRQWLGCSGVRAASPAARARERPSGHLVAEASAARATLAGQRVRVRGEVTKVTDVQDHAFFHIRDSSLGPDGRPADLAVTSTIRPKRGDIATFEGILRADVDVGIGFKYPALLENATVSTE